MCLSHAHSAALSLEAAAQEQKPRRHKMWVPPAPSKDDGIKEVVLSPTFGRKVGSPVRLDDLIKPEERKTARKSYVVGE